METINRNTLRKIGIRLKEKGRKDRTEDEGSILYRIEEINHSWAFQTTAMDFDNIRINPIESDIVERIGMEEL